MQQQLQFADGGRPM